MTITSIDRFSVPQQLNKASKISANRAAEDGAEAILFSGVLQQYCTEQQRDHNSGSVQPSAEQINSEDGSHCSTGIKSSTLTELQMQAVQPVVLSALDSLESITQFQNTAVANTLKTSENASSILESPGSNSKTPPQNLQNALGLLQMTMETDLTLPGNATANPDQFEMIQEHLKAAGHPQNTERDAMTEVLKATSAQAETTALNQHPNSNASKSQQVNNQNRPISEVEHPQNESLALNLNSNAAEGDNTSNDRMNHKAHSDASMTALSKVEGIRSDNDPRSFTSVQTATEAAGSQPLQISSSEGPASAQQLPKAAGVQELPAIWTQYAQLMKSGETKTLRMMLNPEQLGALEIEISLKNGVLTGIVSVETELAHDLIQKQLPQLLSTLESKQITAGTFQMQYRGENGGFSDPSWQEREQRQAKHHNVTAVSEMDQGLKSPQDPLVPKNNHKRLDLLA